MKRQLTPVLLAAGLLGVIAGFLLLSTLASAEEVVRFQDGRYLEVSAHSTENRAIRVKFQGGSFILFPARRVDIIDRDGRIVFVGPRPETDDAFGAVAVAVADPIPDDGSTLLANHGL